MFWSSGWMTLTLTDDDDESECNCKLNDAPAILPRHPLLQSPVSLVWWSSLPLAISSFQFPTPNPKHAYINLSLTRIRSFSCRTMFQLFFHSSIFHFSHQRSREVRGRKEINGGSTCQELMDCCNVPVACLRSNKTKRLMELKSGIISYKNNNQK